MSAEDRPLRFKASPSDAPAHHGDIVYPAAIPFVLLHVAAFAAIWSGVTWRALAICAAFYALRMFAIGAGYHRYFAHRAFSTSRGFQFILAFLAQTTAQSSVLWWASKHRHHHLYSDTAHDTHSPGQSGFFYSHVGWIFARRHRGTDFVKIDDFARYPELRWLHRFEFVPAIAMACVCFALAGWSGLVVGFVWSTVLVYHSTFCINSLAHVRGRRRYVTGDDSRNNWLLALLTFGEGWHNNHHACQSSARQGFRWWEIDLTYYVLWSLSKIGVVWDLKSPPAAVLRNEHRLGQRVVDRAAHQVLARLGAGRRAKGWTSARGLAGGASATELHSVAAAMFGATEAVGKVAARAYELQIQLAATPLARRLDADIASQPTLSRRTPVNSASVSTSSLEQEHT